MNDVGDSSAKTINAFPAADQPRRNPISPGADSWAPAVLDDGEIVKETRDDGLTLVSGLAHKPLLDMFHGHLGMHAGSTTVSICRCIIEEGTCDSVVA